METMEELVEAVKEAVDERIEAEKEDTAESVKAVVLEALQPFDERLSKVEEALNLVDKSLGASKALIGQDLNDTGLSTKSATGSRRDAWGRRVRS